MVHEIEKIREYLKNGATCVEPVVAKNIKVI